MNRLIILSDPRCPDGALNAIARAIEPTKKGVCQLSPLLHRCRGVSGMLDVLRSQPRIDILEIIGHGHDGLIRLGEDDLFKSDDRPDGGVGHADAPKMFEYLSETCQIRLLGCNTSMTGARGRMLLLKLAKLAGQHRIVFGTLSSVSARHFDSSGFKASQSLGLLFSSLAALDYAPPDYEHRQINIAQRWAKLH